MKYLLFAGMIASSLCGMQEVVYEPGFEEVFSITDPQERLDTLTLFLLHGAEPNDSMDRYRKFFPLVEAVARRWKSEAIVLIAYGANVNQIDGSWFTPLEASVWPSRYSDESDIELAKILLHAGAHSCVDKCRVREVVGEEHKSMFDDFEQYKADHNEEIEPINTWFRRVQTFHNQAIDVSAAWEQPVEEPFEPNS